MLGVETHTRTHRHRHPSYGKGLQDAVGGSADRAEVNAILHVVLLQFGQNVLSVRVLPQRRNMGPDLNTAITHLSQIIIFIQVPPFLQKRKNAEMKTVPCALQSCVA